MDMNVQICSRLSAQLFHVWHNVSFNHNYAGVTARWLGWMSSAKRAGLSRQNAGFDSRLWIGLGNRFSVVKQSLNLKIGKDYHFGYMLILKKTKKQFVKY